MKDQTLTKRETFALEIMKSLLVSNQNVSQLTMVQDSIQIADIMISELNKGQARSFEVLQDRMEDVRKFVDGLEK